MGLQRNDSEGSGPSKFLIEPTDIDEAVGERGRDDISLAMSWVRRLTQACFGRVDSSEALGPTIFECFAEMGDERLANEAQAMIASMAHTFHQSAKFDSPHLRKEIIAQCLHSEMNQPLPDARRYAATYITRLDVDREEQLLDYVALTSHGITNLIRTATASEDTPENLAEMKEALGSILVGLRCFITNCLRSVLHDLDRITDSMDVEVTQEERNEYARELREILANVNPPPQQPD